ncbi:unnamed protein product, partial [Cuscuta epithymum]
MENEPSHTYYKKLNFDLFLSNIFGPRVPLHPPRAAHANPQQGRTWSQPAASDGNPPHQCYLCPSRPFFYPFISFQAASYLFLSFHKESRSLARNLRIRMKMKMTNYWASVTFADSASLVKLEKK